MDSQQLTQVQNRFRILLERHLGINLQFSVGVQGRSLMLLYVLWLYYFFAWFVFKSCRLDSYNLFANVMARIPRNEWIPWSRFTFCFDLFVLHYFVMYMYRLFGLRLLTPAIEAPVQYTAGFTITWHTYLSAYIMTAKLLLSETCRYRMISSNRLHVMALLMVSLCTSVLLSQNLRLRQWRRQDYFGWAHMGGGGGKTGF